MSNINIIQVAVEIWGGVFSMLIFLIGFSTRKTGGHREHTFLWLLFISSLLVFADSCTYIFRYNYSVTARMLIRFCIFTVFFLQEYIMLWFSMELNLMVHRSESLVRDRFLYMNFIGLFLTMFGLVTNPLTKLYYYFDLNGDYIRNLGILIPFLIPMLSVISCCVYALKNKTIFSTRTWAALKFALCVMFVCIVIQYAIAGFGLVNLAVCIDTTVLYVFFRIDEREQYIELLLDKLQRKNK